MDVDFGVVAGDQTVDFQHVRTLWSVPQRGRTPFCRPLQAWTLVAERRQRVSAKMEGIRSGMPSSPPRLPTADVPLRGHGHICGRWSRSKTQGRSSYLLLDDEQGGPVARTLPLPDSQTVPHSGRYLSAFGASLCARAECAAS